MEKQIICLDTSVLIDYFRKKIKSNSFFFKLTKKYDFFYVSAITEFEVFIGSNEKQDLYWNEFFNKLTVLPYNSVVNKTAIRINRELKRKRKQINTPDLMIGATARTYNIPLATLNPKHFINIDNLEIVSTI
ncbi:MAG: type II toxin-antitoxin system VapC family toxin [Bacteroidales bacterium]|nr:type II toxin-antitoxin system VapC family toxin [Bacteroidales bacterium]